MTKHPTLGEQFQDDEDAQRVIFRDEDTTSSSPARAPDEERQPRARHKETS